MRKHSIYLDIISHRKLIKAELAGASYRDFPGNHIQSFAAIMLNFYCKLVSIIPINYKYPMNIKLRSHVALKPVPKPVSIEPV